MQEVINAIKKYKLIAILRGVEDEKLIPLAEALYNGGIRLLEITFSANKTVSDEKTAKNINRLVNHFEGRMFIGAGTVLYKKQVELVRQAGGRFIVTPNTDKLVIDQSKECGLVSVVGAFTPTEIVTANNLGANFVKFFPASNLGTDYIKAVTAPLSHIKLLAVGGIKETEIGGYIKAGAYGFGIGSNIIDKKCLANCDWNGITELARKYVGEIENA